MNLQYITQGRSQEELIDEIKEVLDAGISWIQLRIKDAALPFEKIAERSRLICQDRATFIVNDRVDIAKRTDADGVHLGLADMPIKTARYILGPDKIIGGTANTIEDCLSRQKDGADYIGLGPYRYTRTKENLSPILGLDGCREILNNKQLKIPIVIVGGITFGDLKILRETTKMRGIAVSSLIKNSLDKAALVRDIKLILNG